MISRLKQNKSKINQVLLLCAFVSTGVVVGMQSELAATKDVPDQSLTIYNCLLKSIVVTLYYNDFMRTPQEKKFGIPGEAAVNILLPSYRDQRVCYAIECDDLADKFGGNIMRRPIYAGPSFSLYAGKNEIKLYEQRSGKTVAIAHTHRDGTLVDFIDKKQDAILQVTDNQ